MLKRRIVKSAHRLMTVVKASTRLAGSAIPYVCTGAFAFWIPDILLQAARGTRTSIDVLLLTVLLPAICLLIYSFSWKRVGVTLCRTFVGGSMLLGIYLFGPFFALLRGALSGGEGFVSPERFHTFLKFTAIFPVSTYISSAYGGEIFALIITTATIATSAIRELSRQP